MNYTAKLTRFIKTDLCIIGKLQIFNSAGIKVFFCCTMELPDKDNKRAISCIPTGSYSVTRSVSPHFNKYYKVLDVPNRSDILFRVGNYPANSKGCILVGSHYDIALNYFNGSVQGSELAFNKLMALDIIRFKLEISSLC